MSEDSEQTMSEYVPKPPFSREDGVFLGLVTSLCLGNNLKRPQGCVDKGDLLSILAAWIFLETNLIGIVTNLWIDKDDEHPDDLGVYHPCFGIPAMEMISVVIDKDTISSTTLQLYGSISVFDGLDDLVIYNRDSKEDSESISWVDGGGEEEYEILLTGPSLYVISFCDGGRITLDLKGYDDNNEQVVVSKGWIKWDMFSHRFNSYDEDTDDREFDIHDVTRLIAERILSATVGAATLKYVVHMGALKATVEVTLFGENTAKLYGSIQASSAAGRELYSIMLFNKKKDKNNKPVNPEDCIPLSRSVLAISHQSFLQVSANLYHSEGDTEIEIAQGCAVFNARLDRTTEQSICGNNHWGIRVKVSWEVS